MRLHTLVLAVLGSAILVFPPVAVSQTLANPFFDDSTVQTIQLTMDPVDRAGLARDYLEDTYYPASFTWRGITANNIGVRNHGGGASRSPVKPNLDLNFAKYDKAQTFLGLPFVIIKANNEDPSNLHEWISMKLFRRMGLPAPREAPAQVFLNGQLLGFYFIVEHLDETFLQRNFGENTGYLYKFVQNGTYEFENLGTDPSAYAPLLDLKSNQSSGNLQNFMNLVQVINQPASADFTDDQFIRALSAYLNPRLFLTHVAAEKVLSDIDGICGGLVGMNNFYTYQFRGQSLYQMLPWDKDLTFYDAGMDIWFGIQDGPHINLLAQRLSYIPEYRNAYLSALAAAVTALGGAGGWADTEVQREYALIHSAAVDDPNKQCVGLDGIASCGTQDFESGFTLLRTFLGERFGAVFSGLWSAGYAPTSPDPAIQDGGIVVWGGMHALSPGAVAVIAGTGFGSEAQATNLPLPRTLGNSWVAVEGMRAPLFGVSSGGAQILVPNDLSLGSAAIVISRGGTLSYPAVTQVLPATPAIAAVVHADGVTVSRTKPPVAGEVLVILAVGLGATAANLPLDAASPSEPLAWTATTPQISLGNSLAHVAFSGLTPGYLGLYQVNVVVPADLPPNTGSVSLTLTQGGQTTAWTFPD